MLLLSYTMLRAVEDEREREIERLAQRNRTPRAAGRRKLRPGPRNFWHGMVWRPLRRQIYAARPRSA
jgi:hypothetical protein